MRTRHLFPLILAPLIITTSLAEEEVEPKKQEIREFALTTEYFDWDAKTLDYYPFTQDLSTIDEGISGEYSYNWSIGCPATRHMVEAACLGQYSKILCGWWQSRDRAARVAALAIYYCTQGDPEMSPFPRFTEDAKRFEPTEAKERLEEIEFVRTQKPYFQNWLASLVADNLPADAPLLKLLPTPAKPSK